MFRKFLAIWLILTATIFAVGHSLAQMPGMFQPVLLGTPTCTQAASFIARTTSPDAKHTGAYNDLICGLVSDGVWSLLDALYVFATQTTAMAQLNLVSSSYAITLTSAPTFTTDLGYATNGTSSSVDSAFNPTTASSPNYIQNSMSFMMWTTSTGSNASSCCGSVSAGTGLTINPLDGSANTAWRANQNAASSVANGGTAAGSWLTNRTAAGATQMYKNGVSVGTGAVASAAVPNSTVKWGNGTGFAAQTYNAGSIGGSLNAAQTFALYNRVCSFLITVKGSC